MVIVTVSSLAPCINKIITVMISLMNEKSNFNGIAFPKYFGAVENTAEGQKVVSTCFCAIIPNLTRLGGAICFVENVVTDKDFRKQGLGKKVMDKAIEFAREKNCYKVILESGAWREEAHQFYRNLGFDDTAKKSFLLKLKDY